jgi:hypothetical protein
MRWFGLLFFVLSMGVRAQIVRVEGKVKDPHGQGVANAIVVNNRTHAGVFGNARGDFSIFCEKGDTLSITALGYYTRQISLKDSAFKEIYKPVIFLDDRIYQLPTIAILTPRDLEAIGEDIKKLGFNESEFKTATVMSPITFLYESFSKRERSRIEIERLKFEDRKRDLLKELFHLYVDFDIIDLTNEEFDEFIDFMNVSDEYLRTSSQYEFLVFVKDQFVRYKMWKRNQLKWKEDDFNYDKD